MLFGQQATGCAAVTMCNAAPVPDPKEASNMKSKKYILLAIGILVISAADVNAQVKGGSFSITPFAGYSVFDPRGNYEDTETYGLAVGYNFSERFSLEATYAVIDTEVAPDGITHTEDSGGFGPPPGQAPGGGEEIVDASGGTEVDAFEYGLEMIYYIYPGKKFAPYGAIGFGMSEFKYVEDDGDLKKVIDHNAPMGFGFKYFVTDMIAFRGDLRAVFPYDQNNIRATVGVTFQFGGE